MKISLGKWGEDRAAEFMINKGFEIIARNYRRQRAEIDIIAQNSDTLVFLEVKTRSNKKFGSGLEAVTLRKQKQIIKAAMIFCEENDIRDFICRFDVISIEVNKNGYIIEHIPNAFMVES